jgi:hypothetical protein
MLPNGSIEILKARVHIDSLVAVSILCTIETIVALELPDSIVRAGGYESVQSALDHMLPRLEKEWMKKQGARP